MKIENFQLKYREFEKTHIDESRNLTYYLKTGHRQLFQYGRYDRISIMTDNTSNCLSGFCILPKGIFIFHDPPQRVTYADLPISKHDTGKGIIGGSFEHWESVKGIYCQHKSITFDYVYKPPELLLNIDYSFAFIIDMKNRMVDYGYYYNPKGLGDDAWV